MIHYAAIDPDGAILDVVDTAEEATEIAVSECPEAEVSVQDLEAGELAQNPASSERMPEIARAACRIPTIEPSAMDMSLEEAHGRLLPFFKGLIKRGSEVTLYDRALGMADAWIGQNYKTGKEHPGVKSLVKGLTLVPAAHARLAALGDGPYAHLICGPRKREGLTMIQRWSSELPFDPEGVGGKKFTFCAGSNQNCRDSCLVFAGQNASELYNTYRKISQTMALLNEPRAFGRMLVESIARFVRSKQIRQGTLPFFRMNVLSDVPWELIAPWIFERFERLQFYDYTKVPGRRVPHNYDLTFSVSGTNFTWANEEVHRRDRRVAVVFLGMKQARGQWRPIKQKGPKLVSSVPLPHTFWGLPVVDGDVSDVRPLDPAPSCVGLRWKTPSGVRAGVTVDPTGRAFSFVTPVYVVSAEQLGRLERPNPNAEQYLISPVTPRYQPIVHDVAQAEG